MNRLFLPASQIEPAATQWLWDGRIPRGALTVIAGDPGSSKSSFSYYLACKISTGSPLPSSTHATPPGNVLLLQDEDNPIAIERTLRSNGADLARVHLYNKAAGPEIRIPSHVDLLEAAIVANSAVLLVVDPYSSFVEGHIASEGSMRAALRPLVALAERTGAAILLVLHLNKSARGSALYRTGGSIAIVGAARAGLLIAKAPGDDSKRIIAAFKNNLAPLAPSLSFGPTLGCGGIVLDQWTTSEHSAESLLAAAQNGEQSAIIDACIVLHALLKSGPLWAKTVQRLARDACVSERTLRRARELLGAKSRHDGFGRGSQFFWYLPEHNELIQRLHNMELDDLAAALFHDEPPPSPPEKPKEDFRHGNDRRRWPRFEDGGDGADGRNRRTEDDENDE